ncbi:cupredoxin family protein [Labrys sp. LIt4]|uniref:cupredoxin domain-containing protein n=1 Tax=Labrys sp. LIt4 TaxID=2821355 RepID=UPI001ADFE2DD|nr:cupredoxin family protein [Labrys sp. LIt4]MBP0578540.1 cupredoxin family protein [Labrys sp. LIt4]
MFSKILFAAALALAAGPALADAGHAHGEARAYGEPGDAKKPARTIAITMRETDGKMMFIPSKIEVRQGEQIKFVLRNNGEIDHEIVLATLAENLKHGAEMQKNPDMEHDDPNARRLNPKKTGEMIWKFTKVGEFDFSCLIPGHREAGMTGTIVVTAKTGAF